jgi:hypothetical protein
MGAEPTGSPYCTTEPRESNSESRRADSVHRVRDVVYLDDDAAFAGSSSSRSQEATRGRNNEERIGAAATP